MALVGSARGSYDIGCLGLGLTISVLQAAASPAHATARTPLHSEQPVVFDCPGLQKASVRPRAYILTCADGNDYFADLHWTRAGRRMPWRAARAGPGVNCGREVT